MGVPPESLFQWGWVHAAPTGFLPLSTKFCSSKPSFYFNVDVVLFCNYFYHCNVVMGSPSFDSVGSFEALSASVQMKSKHRYIYKLLSYETQNRNADIKMVITIKNTIRKLEKNNFQCITIICIYQNVLIFITNPIKYYMNNIIESSCRKTCYTTRKDKVWLWIEQQITVSWNLLCSSEVYAPESIWVCNRHCWGI